MRAQVLRGIAALALLTCFVCPVLESFDRWDHTLRTGSDTEYTFVLLALCIGLFFSLRQLLPSFFRLSPARNAARAPSPISSLPLSAILRSSFRSAPESPPLVGLRI